MPSQSTYSRFFNQFSRAKNTEIFPEWQAWSLSQVNIERITLDLDSTVITRAGTQQGSAKGYHLLSRGRHSHHPLIALVSQTSMVANAWLRPGNTADSRSCEALLQETLNHTRKDQKVGLLRADSGFYTQGILNGLESESINYIIATRFYPNVKRAVDG